jgi:uncharacterized protein (TIGR03067 family)
MNERTIFLAALDIAERGQRSAYLDEACAGNPRLRQHIEELLHSHAQVSGFLAKPALEQIDEATCCTEDVNSTPKEPVNLEATQAESGVAGTEDLSFLAPSSKPGSIGRLGHYDVLEVIGKGGFGIVLKGFDNRLRRVVAIKVLSPAFAANGSARKRFIREARAAAAVKNEHVVGIYDVQEDAQPPYLVMECIDGISLQDKLDKQGALGVKQILRIGMQIAEGLAVAHQQGLVHRDIKPANILLENGVERVKITDFGLARAVDDASVTQSGTVAGTPMYMSPEQAEGLPVDHRSDLFSLGSVLYAMCTGHPPFRASGTHAVLKRVIDASPRPIHEINSEIPDWLCDIVAKLHAKKPAERFGSAKEVAQLLEEYLAHLQQPGRVPLPAARARPSAAEPAQRRFRWGTVLLAGVGLPLLLAPVFYLAEGWRNHAGTWIGLAALAIGLAVLLTMVIVRPRQPADLQQPDRASRSARVARVPVPEPTEEALPAALRHLRLPANGLLITGILYLATVPFLFVIHFLPRGLAAEDMPFLLRTLGVIPIVVGAVLILAASKMKRGEWYTFCVAAVLLPLALLGEKLYDLTQERLTMALGDWTVLPFGLWALVVLTRRDVRQAFGTPLARHLARRFAVGVALLLLGLGLAGYWGGSRLIGVLTNSAILEVKTVPDREVEYLNDVKIAVWRHGQKVTTIDRNSSDYLEAGVYQLVPEGCFQGAFGDMIASLEETGRVQRATTGPLGEPLSLTLTRGERQTVRISIRRRPPPADLAALQGRWLILSQEMGGSPVPDNMLNSWIEFDQDHIRVKRPSGAVTEQRFLLNADAKPRQIDLFGVGKSEQEGTGIYALDSDSLKLCIGETKNARPQWFTTQPGSTAVLTRCRREKSDSDGWVSLFNGRDLAGWKTLPEQPGDWRVIDNILVGSKGPGHLFSVRDDFQNFWLRAEVAISKGADADIYFRSKMQPPSPPGQSKSPSGYVVDIGGGEDFYAGPISFRNPQSGVWTTFGANSKVTPDEWFTLDIIAEGNHLVTRINGEKVVNIVEGFNAYKKGHIALQTWRADTVVNFHKIEIKELPPEEAGWVQLFNGKDLGGWKPSPGWKVEGNVLTGRDQAYSHLLTERDDFENFHLRVEARLNERGDSGVFLRCQAPPPLETIRGYEAQMAFDNTFTRTGGLIFHEAPGPRSRTKFVENLARPDEWFTLEVIAQDNHLTTKVDGKTAVDLIDAERSFKKGHIGLQLLKNTVVELRKIEIKQLPATAQATASSPPGSNAAPVRIKAFDPAKDKPATEAGVTTDQGGWRVEATKKQDVLLFVVPGQGIKRDGRLVLRGLSRATPAEDGKVDITLLWRRENGYFGGTHLVPLVTKNDWQPWTNGSFPTSIRAPSKSACASPARARSG